VKIAIDSNVLLSVLIKDSLFPRAGALLEKYSVHDYVINDCIYLELAVYFQDFERLDCVLAELEVNHIRQSEIDYDLVLAAWSRYLKNKSYVCPSCKQEISPICPQCHSAQNFRQRVLVDFLIGGFASTHTHAMLTLVPAYYRNYFPKLTLLD